jgi:hypothetical protein
MIDVLSTMHGLLREARFTTHLDLMDKSSIVCFEDDVITGFGRVFEDPASLVQSWKATEMSLLLRYAKSLHTAQEKAWNVYCIFLCGPSASSPEARQIRWIEEDLERTRKVAACGISSREELINVLLPVLPLQYQPLLTVEDVTERLLARIRTIAPKASEVVLNNSVSATEIVRLIGEST